MSARPTASVVHGVAADFRSIPSVDRLLRHPASAALALEHGHRLTRDTARAVLEELRGRADRGELRASELELDQLTTVLAARCQAQLASSARAVINLTGTVIHTNLGRAPLPALAIERIVALGGSANNLEYDLQRGARGDRDSLVEALLCRLTGAQAATVVNNNAAAVLLMIAALAQGREVLVSRGELVEIGGAFRMPDVMASAGARLVEVGTTNRTHPQDYERAINAHTAMLMKVHTSNYAIQGFSSAVDEAVLSGIARRHGVVLASDLGSGSLIDLSGYGLPREPLPQDKLEAGCDVVSFSGDKLLGGPQAGLIVGSREVVERIRRHPLKRALRVSKLPLLALEATLQLYLRPELLARDLPVLRLLTRPRSAILRQARRLRAAVAEALAPRFTVEVVPLMSQIGSGSLPVDRLASAGLRIVSSATRHGDRELETLAQTLRALPRPVLGRIADHAALWDLRCLEHDRELRVQLPQLRAALT